MNAPRRSTLLLSADIGIGSFDAIANADEGPARAAVRVRVVDRDTTTVFEPLAAEDVPVGLYTGVLGADAGIGV